MSTREFPQAVARQPARHPHHWLLPPPAIARSCDLRHPTATEVSTPKGRVSPPDCRNRSRERPPGPQSSADLSRSPRHPPKGIERLRSSKEALDLELQEHQDEKSPLTRGRSGDRNLSSNRTRSSPPPHRVSPSARGPSIDSRSCAKPHETRPSSTACELHASIPRRVAARTRRAHPSFKGMASEISRLPHSRRRVHHQAPGTHVQELLNPGSESKFGLRLDENGPIQSEEMRKP